MDTPKPLSKDADRPLFGDWPERKGSINRPVSKSPARKAPLQKILVIRFSSIGDIVLITPALAQLRRWFPEAEIRFVTRSDMKDLVIHNPHINRVMAFPKNDPFSELQRLAEEIRSWGPDLIVDLHKSLRSRVLSRLIKKPKLTVEKDRFKRKLLFWLRWNAFGPMPPNQIQKALNSLRPLERSLDSDLETELYLSDEGRLRAKKMLKPFIESQDPFLTPKPLIGMVPSSLWNLKKWPESHFSELLDRIEEKGSANVILLGGPNDKECERLAKGRESFVFDTHGKTSLEEAGALMELCSLVITNDTGLMHMAEAVKTNVIALMGPTTSELGFYPYRKSSRVMERNLICRPCGDGRGRCLRFGSKACLTGILPAEVLQVMETMLNRTE
jgi:heptosyltransferase-2